MRIIDDVRVDKSGDCWIWTGTLSGKGYGRIGKRINGKMTLFAVHRLAVNGIVPSVNAFHRLNAEAHLLNDNGLHMTIREEANGRHE